MRIFPRGRARGRGLVAALAILAAVAPAAAAPAPPRHIGDAGRHLHIAASGTLDAVAHDAVALGAIASSQASPEPEAASSESNPPSQTVAFDGVSDAGTVTPPGTSGAVGPAHVVTVTNQELRVQTRAGSAVSSVTLNAFFSSLSSPATFDPRAVYDPLRGRFVVVALADANASTSAVLLAVTATSDPTGTWYRYRFNADGTRGTYFADDPSVGFGSKWITVQAVLLQINGTNRFSRVFLFDREDAYANGTNRTRYGDMFGFGSSQAPAVTLDAAEPKQYLLQNWSGNGGGLGALRLWSIDGPVDAPDITDLGLLHTYSTWADVPPANGADFLPQSGTTTRIRAADARMQNVVLRGGSLWGTQTVFVPAAAPTRASVQWWQIDPAGVSSLQLGRIDDPAGAMHAAYPSIAVNASKDVLVGFSRFSAGTWPTAAYAFRYAQDPAGTTRAPVVTKPGAARYTRADATGKVRWGEWSATQVDPAGDTDFWTVQSYAASTDRWGTWWSSIHPTPGPSAAAAPSPVDFGEQRTTTQSLPRSLVVTSDGQRDLIVGAATVSGANAADFSVVGNGCASRTLAPGETCTITLRFTPSADGPRSAALTISGNDASGADVVPLLGVGQPPTPAFKATPSSVGFGTVDTASSAQRTLTISNADDALLDVTAVTMFGPNAAEFSIASQTCVGAHLAAGQTCTVTLTFTPQDTGARTATLSVAHNAPGSPSAVPLSGSAIPPGGIPRVLFQPSSVDFGATEPGTGATRAVDVFDIGSGSLFPSAVAIEGSADFAVLSQDCIGAEVPVGAKCRVTIAFSPSAFARRTATLVVTHNGGQDRLALLGTGADVTPPASTVTTEPGSIVVGGGGSALAAYNLVHGTSEDRLSTVTRVLVTFQSRLKETTVPARLSCDATGRSCTWSAPAPTEPGIYTIWARGTDAWNNTEPEGRTVDVYVL